MICFGIGFDSTFAIWRRKGRRKWPPIIKLFIGLVLFLWPSFLNATNLAVLSRADPQLAPIEATTKQLLRGGMEDWTEEEEFADGAKEDYGANFGPKNNIN
jgi:hypothetical protein